MNRIEEEARRAGQAITERSIAIIKARLGHWPGSPEELDLVIRVAHTTGDVECAKTLRVSDSAIAVGIQAVRAGCGIVTDVTMVLAGLRRHVFDAWGCTVRCLLEDRDVCRIAASQALTKSAAAMRVAAERGLLDGAIVAVGNAPTALFELLDLYAAGIARPALVIGVPVGFVGAAESKEALIASSLANIALPGERGGSPIAAALANGIAALAAEDGRW